MKRLLLLSSTILLFALCLPSCGNNRHAGSAGNNVADNGSISFTLVWAKPQKLAPGMVWLSQAPDVCVDFGLTTISAEAYDSSNALLANADWQCSSHAGVLASVPTGTGLTFTLKGKDSGGTTLWQGSATNLTITASKTTDSGPITMVYIGNDTTPPTVLPIRPITGAKGVAITSTIDVIFSEYLAPSTINATSFLLASGSTPVIGTVAYDAASMTATFSPYSSLTYSTVYIATITTTVKDIANNAMEGDYSWTFTTEAQPATSDTTPPSSPTGLTATSASSSQINLSWNASTDDIGVTGYKIYRDGAYLKSVSATTASDAGLNASSQYCYVVSAYDAANNESTQSSQQCATTSATTDTTDTTPPTIPTGLTATATSSIQINISWDAATDNIGVTGYKIYRGGTYLKIVTIGTTVNDSSLTPSANYCYTVSAIDAANNESTQSTLVCATTWSLTLVHVPDTGQTTKYTTIFGEDADYNINLPSYTDNGDGTITDNVTGLLWQKQDDAMTRTWIDAGTFCSSLNLGTYSTGWRLPTRIELNSIENYGTSGWTNPPIQTINTSYFPNTTSNFYWSSSSSTAAYLPTCAWSVDFSIGVSSLLYKTAAYYVRCVHGEQTSQSFTDNGDNTISDNITGLMWQKQDDGTARTWVQALPYCEELTLASYSDWRLPNVKELNSLVDDMRYSPAINPEFMNTQSSSYWSSTIVAGNVSFAWRVGFNEGSIWYGYKDWSGSMYYVRCVRGQ